MGIVCGYMSHLSMGEYAKVFDTLIKGAVIMIYPMQTMPIAVITLTPMGSIRIQSAATLFLSFPNSCMTGNHISSLFSTAISHPAQYAKQGSTHYL